MNNPTYRSNNMCLHAHYSAPKKRLQTKTFPTGTREVDKKTVSYERKCGHATPHNPTPNEHDRHASQKRFRFFETRCHAGCREGLIADIRPPPWGMGIPPRSGKSRQSSRSEQNSIWPSSFLNLLSLFAGGEPPTGWSETSCSSARRSRRDRRNWSSRMPLS